jgi:hypothetical protein
MNEPAPSRRRGRPPKNQVITISSIPSLAPPQEPAVFIPDALSVAPVPSPQASAVPSPLPAVIADDVDLRENPVMAARHSLASDTDVRGGRGATNPIAGETPALASLSGSDSKVRGASDGYLPVEAGTAIQPNPALPEQYGGTTSNVEPAPTGAVSPPIQALPDKERIPLETSTETAPAAPVSISWTPVQVGDVVQVSSSRSKHYGTLFIIGDIKNHRVHGYQIGANGKLEYFTVNEDECVLVGSMSRGQVRARKSCSSKWQAEQR